MVIQVLLKQGEQEGLSLSEFLHVHVHVHVIVHIFVAVSLC